MRNLGLTYDDLRRVRPDLIMLSGTSLGQTGPYADAVGWGPTNQAFAGTSYLTGYPGGFPCAGGGTWPDFAVGVAMVFALTAALYHRARTGQGQYIDVSMCEVVTSMMPEAMLDYFMNGVERGPIGNRCRSADEPARHKILDLVGDLSLFGQDLRGHVVAYRSGHPLNAQLARTLVRELAQTGSAPLLAA